MPNGKVLQKLKDELDDKGCEFGRVSKIYINEIKTNINGIGKRVTWATYLLIGTLVGMVVNLIYLYFKK